jgi:hypothetical protein
VQVGTTEQVVKNYLRKIYDKLGVADRLELALYSMHRKLLDTYTPQPVERRERGSAVGTDSGSSGGQGQTSAAAVKPESSDES